MVAVAALVVLVLYSSTAALPFFSEDFSLQGRVEAYRSAWEIFDPAQVPFRPLQHGYFRLLVELGPVAPWLARVPAFALFLLSALLVADLARQLGCSARGAWVALIAYLCFPSVKGLVWVAAISGPGRVTCLLAGLCLFTRHLERPSARTGLGLFAAQLLALAFHPSGIVLAPACLLIVWARSGAPLVRGWPALLRRLREPFLAGLVLVVLAYGLGMSLLWSHGYPQSQPAAVFGNLARASLALFPEALRFPAIEGLRGHGGTLGFFFGLAAVGGAWLAYAVALLRAPPLARALLLAALLDLLLPAVSVGFVVRYAQLAGALCACAAGLALDATAAPSRARRGLAAGLALLLAGWAYDTAFDVAEYREAGAVSRRIFAQAAEARARLGPETTIALVDLPRAGAARRHPPLQLGHPPRACARGDPGPWEILRTKEYASSDRGRAGRRRGELARRAGEPAGRPRLRDDRAEEVRPWE
jgi:hypothetical protein